MPKRIKFIPSLICGLAISLFLFLMAEVVRDAWPDSYSGTDYAFAKEIAEAYRLDRFGEMRDTQLAEHYLNLYKSPEEISRSIANDFWAQSKSKEFVSDSDEEKELRNAFVTAHVEYLNDAVNEVRNSTKPSLKFFQASLSLFGFILGFLLPIALGLSWKFLLSRIRELSLAIQGK
jgi:hypothetical protein